MKKEFPTAFGVPLTPPHDDENEHSEFERVYGGPAEGDGGGVDPSSLEGGVVLQYLVQQMNHAPSDRHYMAVLRCLRDSTVWIPCDVRADNEFFKKLKGAKPGDALSLPAGTDVSADTLQCRGKIYLPVFSAVEQMGDYGNHFSKIERSFLDAVRLALAKDGVNGIVLDAFTSPFIVPKGDFALLWHLKSMLRETPSREIKKTAPAPKTASRQPPQKTRENGVGEIIQDNECGRCHRITQGKMHFIKGREINVCRECAQLYYGKCECCGAYFATEDLLYPGNGGAMCIWCVSSRYIICPHCREFVERDKAVVFHGHLMCSECRDAYFSECGSCHNRFETADLISATDEGGETADVCPACLQAKFGRCVSCETWRNLKDCRTFDGKIYCRDCLEPCQNCHELFPEEKSEFIHLPDESREVCPDCRNLFAACAGCGYDYPKEKLRRVMDEWYCDDCLSEYIADLEEEKRKLVLRHLNAVLVGIIAGKAVLRWLNR